VFSDVQSPKSTLPSNLFPMIPTMNDERNEKPLRTPEEWIEFAQHKLGESGKPAPAVWFLAAQGPGLLEYLMTGMVQPGLVVDVF
jgi:hypothetical protein